MEQACLYLSKKLDPIVSGWLPCLWIIRATALRVKDTEKLTLVKNYVSPPHAIHGVLKQPLEQWLRNTCLTHYRDLLLSAPTNLLPAKYNPEPSLLAPRLGSPGTSP